MLHSASADFYPDLVVKTHGVYQVRFSIVERDWLDGMNEKPRKVWDYEYAETPIFEYGAIVDAIIGTRYGKDSEIALVNKAIADSTNPDYEEYNAFRVLAKQGAKDAMAWWESK
jgi:hypothetical protein